MMYLEQVVDPEGVADGDVDGIYHFSDYKSFYETGHGRKKCNPRMCVKPGQPEEAVPSNCGFHKDWIKPNNFKECGPSCRGGFCQCISANYDMNDFCDDYYCDEEGWAYDDKRVYMIRKTGEREK